MQNSNQLLHFEQIFLRLARKHLSEHFPNPERLGCPPEGKLKVLGANPRQVEAWVVDHLSFCSPCYRAYSRIVQELRSVPRHNSNRPKITPNRTPGCAAGSISRLASATTWMRYAPSSKSPQWGATLNYLRSNR